MDIYFNGGIMEDNKQNYLSVLSEPTLSNGTLSDEELYNLQSQLWLLLGQRTERYSMGDSSSIPIEVAQELLKSICYCIDIYLKSKDNNNVLSQIKTVAISQLFSLGLAEVERQITLGKEFLCKAAAGTLQIDNLFYNDTLSQIECFFKKYNYRFFAHEIPCRIDYPLCHSIEALQGIEYINKYLHGLTIENDFCRHFDIDKITALLQAYASDYKAQLVNIYELAANNVIGLALIKGNIFVLDISKADREQIIEYLLPLSRDNAIRKLVHAAEEVCNSLDIIDLTAQEYLKRKAIELYSRIEAVRHTNCFDMLFISLHSEQEEKAAAVQYIDSAMMEDEALRNLISELQSCRFMSDKILIVKQQVHSLRDLAEVLSICFWDDECIDLFDSLDSTEIALLLHFLHQKRKAYSSWQSESGWELQLLSYIEKIEPSKKIEIENMINEIEQ